MLYCNKCSGHGWIGKDVNGYGFATRCTCLPPLPSKTKPFGGFDPEDPLESLTKWASADEEMQRVKRQYDWLMNIVESDGRMDS